MKPKKTHPTVVFFLLLLVTSPSFQANTLPLPPPYKHKSMNRMSQLTINFDLSSIMWVTKLSIPIIQWGLWKSCKRLLHVKI